MLVEHHERRRLGHRREGRGPGTDHRRSHRRRPGPSPGGNSATAHPGASEPAAPCSAPSPPTGTRRARPHAPRRRRRRRTGPSAGGSRRRRCGAARTPRSPRPGTDGGRHDRRRPRRAAGPAPSSGGDAARRNVARRPAQRHAAHGRGRSSPPTGRSPRPWRSFESVTPSGGSTSTADHPTADPAPVQRHAHHRPDRRDRRSSGTR